MFNFIGGALLIRFVDIVLIKDIFKCHLATENKNSVTEKTLLIEVIFSAIHRLSWATMVKLVCKVCLTTFLFPEFTKQTWD